MVRLCTVVAVIAVVAPHPMTSSTLSPEPRACSLLVLDLVLTLAEVQRKHLP